MKAAKVFRIVPLEIKILRVWRFLKMKIGNGNQTVLANSAKRT